jgi:hypothetical protein
MGRSRLLIQEKALVKSLPHSANLLFCDDQVILVLIIIKKQINSLVYAVIEKGGLESWAHSGA